MGHGPMLGIDVGSVRVGVAACDPGRVLATPVETVARDVAGGSDVERVVAIFDEKSADAVIVGLPRSLDGQERAAAESARSFASALAKRLPRGAVRMVDERFTTTTASQQMQASGVSARGQRQTIDQAAAVVILQTALDTEARTGHPVGDVVGGRKPRAKVRATEDGAQDG